MPAEKSAPGANRPFVTMMQMEKLDIRGLEQATLQ